MTTINSHTGAAFEAGAGRHRNGEAPLGVEPFDAREEERPRSAPPGTGLHRQPALATAGKRFVSRRGPLCPCARARCGRQ